MPIVHAQVKSAQSVWRSPDGAREIFGVILDVGGQELRAKTYSKDISQEGWSGEVETYEKPGRNGTETFVKQAPKENASYGGSPSYSKGGGSKPQAQGDNYTMYLSYVKDVAVALVNSGKYTEELLNQTVTEVATSAQGFYELSRKLQEGEAVPEQAKLEEVDPWG